MDQPCVSIVVIGLNEEKNLNDTFNAVLSMAYPRDKIELIYVDTGSKDKSVEIASKYTEMVFVEKNRWPTSGLARNRGLLEASNEIIHFIDGDISISKDYLKDAIKRIVTKKADAVTGYFKEKYTDKFFNRIMNFRRDDIIHREREYESTNGGGTYLKSKLLSVNGYDERILKGQESEMGIRFRAKGNKILFIDSIQGVHNFDLSSIWDFIRFKYNYGRSFGYLIKIKEDISEYILRVKKVGMKLLFVSTLSIVVIIISVISGYYILILFYYFFRMFQIYYKTIRQNRTRRQLYYDLLHYLFNFATFGGILYVLVNPYLKPGRKQVL